MQARHDQTGGGGMNRRLQRQTSAQPPSIALPATTQGEEIDRHRQCPLCWNGRGGYGLAYSTQGKTRYYRCAKTRNPDSHPCGHTWTVRVELETIVIQHRIVRLDGER